MNLTLVSTWIGIIGYSILIGTAVLWVGISIANWLSRHAPCALVLGFGALCFAMYFSGIVTIASDWFPWFAGPYVALGMRVIALLGSCALLGFTIIYLNRKRRQEPC